MRLQLRMGLLSAALAASPAGARAEWGAGVDARTSLYQDTDRTTISTTVVGARVSPNDRWTISGHYLADVITSASVDVVTSATAKGQCSVMVPSPASCPPQPFHETRNEGAASVAYADGTRTASVGYVHSIENDWRSHSVSAGYSNDLLQHQLTLGLSGSFTTNDVWRAHEDPSHPFHRKLDQGSASFDVGIVGSKRDLVTLDYTFMFLRGYQASPYRFVFYTDPALSSQPIGAPETDPDTRTRHALAVRWVHHAFSDTVIKLHARGYVDDWGVASGTAGAEYVVGFGELELGASLRGYAQKGAAFYQDGYDVRRRYMTADRELSTFIDAFGSLRFGWARTRRLGVLEALHAELKATGFAFKFFDFSRLPARQGIIAELALGGAI
jgi:hypothetical protein